MRGTMMDIKSINVYCSVNSNAATKWRKKERANCVHLEGVASDNRSFFFQAEDGIRDIGVTGVQTCALPILRGAEMAAGHERRRRKRAGQPDQRKRPAPSHEREAMRHRPRAVAQHVGAPVAVGGERGGTYVNVRSEERRVGKECRARGWACE